METISARLKKEIAKSGLTVSAFAKMTNIAQPTLSRMLNDKQKITERYLAKASIILNVPLDYLLLKTDDENPLPAHNLQKTNDKYKLDMTVQIMEQFGYKVYEFIDLEPDITFIDPNKKVWLREGDIFLKEYYMVLSKTGFPLGYDENKREKISNKQMMNRIQNESGPITHKYIIVSPDRSVKCIESPTFSRILASLFNIFESTIPQILAIANEDRYLNPFDNLIKYKDILIQDKEIDSFIHEFTKEE